MAFDQPNVEKIKVAVVMGSTRAGRFCDTVTAWLMSAFEGRCEFSVQVIDPAELPMPGWADLQESAGVAELRQRLDDADAFIVVTPEYNHSFTGALKTVIDMAYEEWQAKPVGFVSYGGVSGGLRAVEQLRLVFAELHAVTLRDSVSFASAWNRFDEHGQLREPEAAEKSLNRMLAKLHWWASALRDARQQRTYSQVA
ncbi:MAG: NAD(P)H-dependent oxidoreductase [Pseudohongiella sp.]|uniref:NADPH-dependent FMN reductase n=1 Tax=Pseudohongiella sp. TaxID=1979412 RepID=UPI0034A08B92